ncbi:MAG: OmpA family protein [Alphaproteobacteria bacterium]|nr:OmpA family protein [Alphaproteobacteria bacterium]
MRATRYALLCSAALLLAALAQPALAQRGIIVAQATAPSPAPETAPNAQKKKEPGQHPPGAPQQRPGTPAAHPPAQGQAPATQHPATKELPPPTQRPAQTQPPAPPVKQQAQPPAKQLPTPPQPPAAQQQPAPAPAQPLPQQAQPPAKQLPQPTPPAAQQRPATPQPPAAQTQPPAGQATPRVGAAPAVPSAPAAALPGPLAPAPQQANARRLDEVRTDRHETREGNRTVIREPGRVIIQEGGHTIIRHDEADRFRVGGGNVRTERRGNDIVTVIVRPDGTQIVSVVDENGRLIRRTRRWNDGREIVIIDNQGPATGSYYVDLPPPVIRIPRERYIVEAERASEADIYAALEAAPVDRITRRYSLDEIRYSQNLRERMPRVDIDTVNFETGSWEVTPDQMDRLAPIAQAILQAVQRSPGEVFLIEGHTDAVGSDVDNLSLSDRRAESVAVALSQQFQVPAENLTTQGYGAQFLKIPTQAAERQNRRVTIRRITPLLAGGAQTGG